MMAARNITRRLLPRHEFNINCWNDDGNGFVKLFRDTWKRTPLPARRAILRFWRANSRSYGPLIELSNMWAPSEAYGQVGRVGMELKFRQEAFACFPAEIARWVIAHELAHIYQKACGRQPGGANEEENEDDANNIANKWGFDQGYYLLLRMLREGGGLSLANGCAEVKRIINELSNKHAF